MTHLSKISDTSTTVVTGSLKRNNKKKIKSQRDKADFVLNLKTKTIKSNRETKEVHITVTTVCLKLQSEIFVSSWLVSSNVTCFSYSKFTQENKQHDTL